MTLEHRILPADRIKIIKQAIQAKKTLRIMEAHNALSALIVNTSSITHDSGEKSEFDGVWISSFTDSAAKGHPDIGVIDGSSRIQTIQEIIQVTNKPIIVDGDTGGEDCHFEYFCSKLEMLGVSAVVIEDKIFPKRNSLDQTAIHLLEDPQKVIQKIKRAKQRCISKDFMIFARIESLNAGNDLQDAILRATTYLDSEADGIVIHSRKKSPEEIYAFADSYQNLCNKMGIHKPLVCIPTTYNQVYESELIAKGFTIIIYANQLLRAAHKAMHQACISILTHERSFETESSIASLKEIYQDTGFLDVKKRDEEYESQ